jgi:hypothetical protein
MQPPTADEPRVRKRAKPLHSIRTLYNFIYPISGSRVFRKTRGFHPYIDIALMKEHHSTVLYKEKIRSVSNEAWVNKKQRKENFLAFFFWQGLEKILLLTSSLRVPFF